MDVAMNARFGELLTFSSYRRSAYVLQLHKARFRVSELKNIQEVAFDSFRDAGLAA